MDDTLLVGLHVPRRASLFSLDGRVVTAVLVLFGQLNLILVGQFSAQIYVDLSRRKIRRMLGLTFTCVNLTRSSYFSWSFFR